MSGVLTVAAGAVEGLGTVYSGLEQSAAVLGNSLSNNTVRVVEHKYGPQAGQLTAETFDTVGNLFNITQNVKILEPRTFVKRTGKTMGKAMISGYRVPAAAQRLRAAGGAAGGGSSSGGDGGGASASDTSSGRCFLLYKQASKFACPSCEMCAHLSAPDSPALTFE